MKDSKHYFEKISTDLDAALTRNSQTPRSKSQEADESLNVLSATRSCFRHQALDYVHGLSLLHSRKRHEVLGTVSFSQSTAMYYTINTHGSLFVHKKGSYERFYPSIQ